MGASLFESWRSRAEQVGPDANSLRAFLQLRGQSDSLTFTANLATALVGEGGLTAEAATFSRRDLVRRIAAMAVDGLTHPEIEELADRVLSNSAAVVPLGAGEVPQVVVDHDRDARAGSHGGSIFDT